MHKVGKALYTDKEIREANQMLTDFVLCETFGWTLEEIRDMSILEYDCFTSIIDIRDGIRKVEQEKAEKKAKMRRK